MTGRRTARAAGVGVLLGGVFAPFLAGFAPGESAWGAILVATAGIAAPGCAGALWPGGGGAARGFVRFLLGAVLLNGGAILALKLAGVEPGPISFAAALGLLTVGAGVAGAARRGCVRLSRGGLGAFAAATGGFLLAWGAGAFVVPPLEDQDSEVQGTAYGLMHDLEPLCLTNRSTLYFFAHPLLLHLLNASTLTLAGELETVRPPYEAAREERAALVSAASRRRLGEALRAFLHREVRPDRSRRWWHEVYRPFRARPARMATRAPNWVLAGAVAVLLFATARRFGTSSGDALLLTATYATLPEVFVRSGYGGYYAISAATFLAGVVLASGDSGGGRSGYFAGALAMLANQKALVPGLGVALVRFGRALRARSGRAFAPALPWLLGIAGGGAAFWIYGLAIAPGEFVADHVIDHGLGRFLRAGAERAKGSPYPSPLGLWWEFARHMGWAWTGIAAAALAGGIRAGAHFVRGREGRSEALRPMLTAWVIVGAIVFTATDWRQTKHLCLLVPALALLGAALVAGAGRRCRWALRVGFALSLAWNLDWLARLAGDFASLEVTPLW